MNKFDLLFEEIMGTFEVPEFNSLEELEAYIIQAYPETGEKVVNSGEEPWWITPEGKYRLDKIKMDHLDKIFADPEELKEFNKPITPDNLLPETDPEYKVSAQDVRDAYDQIQREWGGR